MDSGTLIEVRVVVPPSITGAVMAPVVIVFTEAMMVLLLAVVLELLVKSSYCIGDGSGGYNSW